MAQMHKSILFILFLLIPLCSFARNKPINQSPIAATHVEEKYYGDDNTPSSIKETYTNEIENIEKYLNSFTSLTARFKQSNINGDISYGNIFISKPGKIRCEYINPSPILLIINNQNITYYDKKLDEASYTTSNAIALKILALEAIKLNNLDIIAAEKEHGSMNLSIKEYNQDLKQYFIVTLLFSYPKIELKQIKILSEDNEVTAIFDKIHYNRILGKELFYFHRELKRKK